jgi:hypothetical protein
MAPAGTGGLYVELSEREREPELAAIAHGLVEIGALASIDDIHFSRTRDIEYAYVVFDEDHAQATATIMTWLAQVGVRSCGRYGAWIYNSMEDSVLSGLAAARWADGDADEAAATEAVARREAGSWRAGPWARSEAEGVGTRAGAAEHDPSPARQRENKSKS